MDIVDKTLLVLGDETYSLTRMIDRLDKMVFRRITRAFSGLNVSQTQALFIIYIYTHANENVYQKALEQEFGITNPTATASLRSLIKKDIVWREQDPHDGRYYRLHLTKKGETLFQPCLDAHVENEQYFSSALSVEERAQLIGLLEKLRDNS